MRNTISILLACFFWTAQAQEIVHREAAFTKIEDQVTIKVDGIMDEKFWETVSVLDGFVQQQPNPGAAASSETQVRIAYSNEALYIFAEMREKSKENVLSELSVRDALFRSNTDIFGIYLDPYQSGNMSMGFFVSPKNVQADIFRTNDEEDITWDVVWESATQINETGWTAELKIPFSMLRFPKKEMQQWNLNILRRIRRLRETTYYNYVNPNVDGFLNQFAYSTPLEDINPPFRLSVTPYMSVVRQGVNGTGETSLRGGADIKWGLNEAFTLDMTLIPDFSQVRTDNQVLNLSPFEIQFQENRPFFTEGIDLFSRGSLFYSRRIGGNLFNPLAVNTFVQNNPSYRVEEIPQNGQLLNAIKLTGRTKKGLGVGVLNSVVAKGEAILTNNTGDKKRVEVQPLSNYNMVVLDQNLPNNSSASFINTFVWRDGDNYDANVSALDIRLRDQRQSHEYRVYGSLSNKIYPTENDAGVSYSAEIKKIKGNWRYTLGTNHESDTYDTNDLGFLFAPNERSYWLEGGYYKNEPWKNNIRGNITAGIYNEHLYAPSEYAFTQLYLNTFLLTKNFWGMGTNFNVWPAGKRDFFEPRRFNFDRYLAIPASASISGFISTNYAKIFAIDISGAFEFFDQNGRWLTEWNISPRLRLSDKLAFINDHNIQYSFDEQGWVGNFVLSGSSPIGERDRLIVSNEIGAKYTFTPRINLNARVRHYWSQVTYSRLFNINAQSKLVEVETPNDFENNANINFNTFNVDINFTWRFAPGSDLIIAWTQQLFQNDNRIETNYFQQFDNLFNDQQTTALSLKVLYFLDYQQVKTQLFEQKS